MNPYLSHAHFIAVVSLYLNVRWKPMASKYLKEARMLRKTYYGNNTISVTFEEQGESE